LRAYVTDVPSTVARWDARPLADDERAILEDRLEFHRTALLRKCAGLNGEQLALRAAPSSALSLPGLIRHAAKAERLWFRQRAGGEDLPRRYPPGEADIHAADAATAEADYAALLAERAACRAVARSTRAATATLTWNASVSAGSLARGPSRDANSWPLARVRPGPSCTGGTGGPPDPASHAIVRAAAAHRPGRPQPHSLRLGCVQIADRKIEMHLFRDRGARPGRRPVARYPQCRKRGAMAFHHDDIVAEGRHFTAEELRPERCETSRVLTIEADQSQASQCHGTMPAPNLPGPWQRHPGTACDASPAGLNHAL
jgi:uncharacterized protein DUF664